MVPAQNKSLRSTVPEQVPGLGEPPMEDFFPLSYAQETLWLAEQVSPGTPTYNLPEAWVLQGEVNPTALQQAMDEIVCRHETLRTLFRSRDGRPEQVVLAAAHLEINRVDLGPITDQEGELQRPLAIEARVPFDLARAPLARATLFRTGEDRHVLYLNVHHLISDAWSQSILIRELVDRYSAKILQQSCAIPPLPVQFADFSLWQRDLLKSDLGQAHLAYWKNIMRTAPDALALFPGHPTSDSFVHRGSTHFLKISSALKSALREVGRRDGATLFMTLLAGFEALLHRYTLEEQIVVGIPMACRERIELDNVIGFFVHTQPVCPNLSGDPTFLELLRRIRESVLQASEHQEVPCELALQSVAAARAAAARPLFQFVFGWQGAAVERWTAPGLSASKIELETGTAKFPWTILISECPDGLLLRSEFSTALFEPATMTRLLRQFQTLLECVALDPTRNISRLELESRSENEVLVRDGGQTESEYERESRIHELFEAQAVRTPNSVAVEFSGEFISYAELNGRANTLANHLLNRGVEPGTSVGLSLNRSVELIVGMLAILKACAAYVPLDPESPPDRLKLLLEDCSILHVVTNSECALRLPPLTQERVVLIDEQPAKLAGTEQQNPKTPGSSTDLAYVMYTSGSTGIPKGTLIPHRAVLRLVRHTNYLEFSSDLVFLQYAPVCFDASTFEIWGALLNGARLVVAPPGILSLEQLGRLIRECRISTLWLTAGLFNQMVDHRLEDLRGLKHLLTGGEALSPSHVSRALVALPGSQLINGYGPTENTTFTCCYRLPRSWPSTRPVPIGHPISNTGVHVLDQNMRPVPVGVPGELYAGGDGLALGYLKRPELTAERFVSNPFETGSVLYRTGDLVRWAPDGTLEFLRRLDNQVKIRGHRIEPGEVENVLAQVPWVESSAVVAQDRGGTKQLVAYVVARANSNSSKDQLRPFLASKLPAYAVPAHVFIVTELPLTTNGKIDRRALEQRALTEAQPQQPLQRSAKNATEAQLVEIWQEVLGREQIGVEQNFFELGGHSLMATQMISRICRVFKRELAVGSIFDAPTIAELAAVVEATAPMQSRPEPAAVRSIGAVQAAQLLERLDEFSEAELDQLLQSTALQSTL